MGKTTLTVQDETLDRFNNAKGTPEGRVEPSADLFLNKLLDLYDDETAIMPDDPGAYAIDDVETELVRLFELVGRIPDKTANELEERFR